MDDKRALFSAVFGNNNQQTTTKRSETTMAKGMTASLPIDDPELSNVEAIAAQLRADHEDMQLLKERLDGMTEGIAALHSQLHGMTEALAAIASDVKALAAAPAAAPRAASAAPAGGGAGETKTVGISAVYNATKTKRDGGTYLKPQVKLANGWERDIRREDMKWFEARVGQEVTVKAVKNERGYETLYPV